VILKGEQDVEIDAKITGYITKICVTEGAFVKTGQTLFLIDDDDYKYNVTNKPKQKLHLQMPNLKEQN